jgi:hypothetical protein
MLLTERVQASPPPRLSGVRGDTTLRIAADLMDSDCGGAPPAPGLIMKKDRIQFLLEALPPVSPPAERRRFTPSTQSAPVRILQDEIRPVLRSPTRAFLNYRAKRPRPVHARRNTVCII